MSGARISTTEIFKAYFGCAQVIHPPFLDVIFEVSLSFFLHFSTRLFKVVESRSPRIEDGDASQSFTSTTST